MEVWYFDSNYVSLRHRLTLSAHHNTPQPCYYTTPYVNQSLKKLKTKNYSCKQIHSCMCVHSRMLCNTLGSEWAYIHTTVRTVTWASHSKQRFGCFFCLSSPHTYMEHNSSSSSFRTSISYSRGRAHFSSHETRSTSQ